MQTGPLLMHPVQSAALIQNVGSQSTKRDGRSHVKGLGLPVELKFFAVNAECVDIGRTLSEQSHPFLTREALIIPPTIDHIVPVTRVGMAALLMEEVEVLTGDLAVLNLLLDVLGLIASLTPSLMYK